MCLLLQDLGSFLTLPGVPPALGLAHLSWSPEQLDLELPVWGGVSGPQHPPPFDFSALLSPHVGTFIAYCTARCSLFGQSDHTGSPGAPGGLGRRGRKTWDM